ncbi:hypothetical protein FRC12_011832 [Ceratobasidium sp. 428]|nr:hypothetical protein FRC12_011832 [Ceratobasidium sp. 428]
MPLPNAQINAGNDESAARRRTARNAMKLAARYVPKVTTTPGIQDATQTMRGIIADLKPAILQAPKANNKLIKQELARIEEIKEDVARIGKQTKPLDDTDEDSSVAHFRWQLQRLSE